jgi:hypothetical protein
LSPYGTAADKAKQSYHNQQKNFHTGHSRQQNEKHSLSILYGKKRNINPEAIS